jgi:hypothetical protein
MPPFYPPVAAFMAVELAAMAACIGASRRLWPRAPAWAVLLPVLLLGRVLHAGLDYLFSLAAGLPARFMAALSFVRGWPGIVLMLVVVPALVRIVGRQGGTRNALAGEEKTR